jgi:hypothetical protein
MFKALWYLLLAAGVAVIVVGAFIGWLSIEHY